MLTPVAFAPLIRCDGSGNAYRGLTLCTDNFTIPDIVRLMNVLLIRYGIHSDPRVWDAYVRSQMRFLTA